MIVRVFKVAFLLIWAIMMLTSTGSATSNAFKGNVFDPGPLKATDSVLKVKLGDPAPDFTLPSISGTAVTLSHFQGKKNVLISFVPAAWTPVCSDQWPGYNIARPLFEKKDTEILGITADNVPTLFSWTREMGSLWFNVLSDFWPHGKTASAYGVMRSDGTTERALILVDKQGIIRWIHVSDINIRPDLGMIVKSLEQLE